MSNYTEADVERDARIAGVGMGMDSEPGPRALARLKAAALEGAKVPGLRAALDRIAVEMEAGGVWSPDEIADRTCSHIRGLESEVSALQARVAELEREHAGWKLTAENRLGWWQEAVKQRDALRAQVDTARHVAKQLAAWVKFRLETDGLDTCTCAPLERCAWCRATKDVDALSASPAETETDDEAHRRLDALGVPRFGRCPATNKRESLTLEERRELAPPAETTPATERARRGPGEDCRCFLCLRGEFCREASARQLATK